MPKDGTLTRQRILDAAERLVIENGFAATSVDQVIADSQTSKGSFFHHFDSKLALAQALVERYAAADVATLDEAIAAVEEASVDPVRRVLDFVQIFEDNADELMAAQSSCLYVSILTERQLVDSGTADQIVAAIETWRRALSRLVDAAFLARTITDVDAEVLADHVFVTFEGAFLLSRSTSEPNHMRTQLHVLRQLLAALLN